MNEKNNLTKYEKAEKDYILGMKYKDIAAKYGVAESTVKTWKRRYGWQRPDALKKVCKKSSIQNLGNNFDEIKEDLLSYLEINEIEGEHYKDLVNTYMELYKVRNSLILDIAKRGVSVLWQNGKQTGMKKNDSIAELNKTVSTMLKILDELGLKAKPEGDGIIEDL
ncbi:helix-turn-helix domain-containing protein [Intestinibacter sp.]|uniref:helix-turn-helix domain-containing protein n=1 Tax=Intestinibacter sp. TaxID=1965304 RepID=UPI002F3F7DB9